MNTKAFKYGAIATVIMAVGTMLPFWFLGTDFDYDWGEVAGYTTILLAMGTIFFALKQYRKELEEQMTFKQGMIYGTYINFIASVLFGVFSYITYAWWYPDFLQSYMDNYIVQVRNSGDGPEAIQAQLAEIEANRDFYLSPVIGGLLMFINVFPIGLAVTAISSYLLKAGRD